MYPRATYLVRVGLHDARARARMQRARESFTVMQAAAVAAPGTGSDPERRMVRMVGPRLLRLCTIVACTARTCTPVAAAHTSLHLSDGEQSHHGEPDPVELAPALSNFTATAGNVAVITAARGPAGQPAIQINVTKVAAEPYNVAVFAPTVGAIAKSDVIFVSFLARAIAPAEAYLSVAIQGSEATGWAKAFMTEFPITGEWQNFTMAFTNDNLVSKSLSSVPAGAATIELFVGYPLEVLQISQVSMLNYGQSKSPTDFPACCFNYTGRGLDASWRAPADARIQTLRKARLTVRVLSHSTGTLVDGASVTTNMTRHLFRHGTCVVGGGMVTSNSADGDVYRKYTRELFNHIGMCNGLKWGDWEDPWHHNETMKVLAWAQRENFSMRGHNLVWPSCTEQYYLPLDVCEVRVQSFWQTGVSDSVRPSLLSAHSRACSCRATPLRCRSASPRTLQKRSVPSHERIQG